MTFSKSTWAPRRFVAFLALLGVACAAAGSSGDGASSPDGVSCNSFTACDDQQQCSDGAQCFKLECGSRACVVLESQPMMISCR
jgi:hypothetical protein